MIETDTALHPFEVTDLGGASLFELITDTKHAEWRTARKKLRLAYQLCVTNPAGPGIDPATWGDGLPGLAGTYDGLLGGEGTPQVARFVVENWATATGTSTTTAMRYLAHTLDLHHRLPRTHARVEALELEVWKGLRLAEDTHHLSKAAARWIDEQLHDQDNYSIKNMERATKHAIAKFHPELLRDNNGLPGREDWDVILDHDHGVEGTSTLNAVGGTLDLAKFHNLLGDEAATLGKLGDTDTLGQRKAKALGRIADRQATLDLLGLLDHPDLTKHDEHPETGKTVTRRRSYLKARLFIHLSLADLATMTRTNPDAPAPEEPDNTDASADGEVGAMRDVGVGETNMFGPLTTDLIADYLHQLGVDAKVTPVIDTNRSWATDAHDPTDAMRDQVIARDPHCVGPYCGVPSTACDLDHIKPYDPDGPPGQTHPDGLAPLCRRHHLLKTHGGYQYIRNRDGTCTWTDRHGRSWLVTTFGTTELT